MATWKSLEKIEISYRRRRAGKSPVIRLFVWSDRWAWIDAREGAKVGWRWEWTGEGRVAGGDLAPAVVEAFEKTIAELGSEEAGIHRNLDLIWRPLLAKGPASVRQE